jgi:hypothetical protein
MTATRQRNAVSEGMALGLGMSGVVTLPYDKLRIDLSFEGAWRDWEYRNRFSQVTTDLSKGLDGVHVMTRATEGKHVWALYWDKSGRELAIYPRQDDWDPTDPYDVGFAVSVISDEVPLAGWIALARAFLERMQPSGANEAGPS